MITELYLRNSLTTLHDVYEVFNLMKEYKSFKGVRLFELKEGVGTITLFLKVKDSEQLKEVKYYLNQQFPFSVFVMCYGFKNNLLFFLYKMTRWHKLIIK